MLRPLAWLAPALLLAGCIGGNGPDEVVGREQTFVVHVLGPDEPVPGEVRLNLFWQVGDALYHIGGHAHDGEAVFHVPREVVEVRLRAGGDGWANDMVGVKAAAADGQATVQIYPAKVEGRVEGVWQTPNPPASPLPMPLGVALTPWRMHDVTPGATEETRAGFQSRLVRANATLAWSNGPGAQADFGAGLLRRDAADECAFADNENQFGVDGAAQESLEAKSTFGYDPCKAYLSSGDPDGLPLKGILAGPMARGAVVGPVGYAVDYRLEFGDPVVGDAFEFDDGCPVCHYDTFYEVDPETGDAYRMSWPLGAAASPALAAMAVLLLAAIPLRRRKAP
ncbi:MAG: hypothetical protein QOD77_769 [Thermoplasmata archaeon]|jgi:hypothetical protein|nr:hypothetical protein [Thermoplasmata archaeon]